MADEGSFSWGGLIDSALRTYAQVETARAGRGMAGAYEDRDVAMMSAPLYGVDTRAASYESAPPGGINGLWLLAIGGVVLLLVMQGSK